MLCTNLALEDIPSYVLRFISCGVYFPILTIRPLGKDQVLLSTEHSTVQAPVSAWSVVPTASAEGWRVRTRPHPGEEPASPRSPGGSAFLPLTSSCSFPCLFMGVAWVRPSRGCTCPKPVVTSLRSCLPFTGKGLKQESLTEAVPPRLEHW